MATQPVINFNQLQVLLTIVDAGSFTAAAKKLNRATSGITYTIDMLEAQLGLTLFHRNPTRRTTLTKAGAAIVAEARSVAHGADMFQARVKGLRDGLEFEISLVVDEMFPTDRLTEALRRFDQEFPTVSVRLSWEVLGGPERLVRSGQAGIGLCGIIHTQNEGLTSFPMRGVALIPVAAPGHALAQACGDEQGSARDHLQIVVTERYNASEQNFGILGKKTWRVTELSGKRSLLLGGLGWGLMPEPMIRTDIESGRLVRLELPELLGGEYPLQLVHRHDTPPSVAGKWLIDRLVE